MVACRMPKPLEEPKRERKPSACTGRGESVLFGSAQGDSLLLGFVSALPPAVAAQLGIMSEAWRVSRITNPKGWQRVAEGRNAVEPPGSGLSSFGTLEGCQSSATPPGSNGDFGIQSGGIASAFAEATADKSLNPRLLSGKPPACSLADRRTNNAPHLTAARAMQQTENRGWILLAVQVPVSSMKRPWAGHVLTPIAPHSTPGLLSVTH
jgi:hypothetical protein